ncbi:MAG: TonB-dependent receptor [Crocinitomicaceae bacterium]|nr:TonB-dependent receptor [Crocinitomicaceae bacterium]
MRLLLSLLLIFSATLIAHSQTSGTVRGIVKNADDGNGIPFAKVLIVGTEKFDQSDVDGLFSIPDVPAGKYTIRITSSAFATFTKEIEVIGGGIVDVVAEMKTGKELTQVDVIFHDKDKVVDPRTSVVKITNTDIKRVPVTGGTADIAGYFQTVPGVVTTGDQGGQVYVRGGTPIQNKVLLDGMTIYNPFHSIGFYSVFETELIRSADIYTGGFNAKYGGRISSVMDISYRDGNFKRFGGALSLSPFTSQLLLEGPITKAKNISFVFSGKASVLEQTSKTLYPYINDGEGLPFNFYDFYGKVTVQGDQANKFSVFGFSFNDQVTYQAVSNLKWNSYGGGSNFIFVPDNSELFMKGRFNFSTYDILLQEENLADRSSGILGGELAFDFTYHLPGKSKLDYGFGFNYFQTDFETFNEINRKIEEHNSSVEAGAYINYRHVSANRRMVIEPGIRFQGYASVGVITAEPRLSAKYNITEFFRFKMAGGYFTQNFTSTTSDKDVVNLFYGFITAPQDLPSTFVQPDGDEIDVRNGLQKAWHAIGGFEVDLTKKLSLNIEGYYKWFNQMTNVNANKLFEDDETTSQIADVLKKDFIVESGVAFGGDIVFTYTTKKFYLWAVYAIGKVDRWDGFQTYPPVFDRRHNVNLISTYSWGKDETWEVTARWNLGSGFPFKQTNGVYEKPDVSNPDDDYWTGNANSLTFLYDDANNGRLPTYHRLDVNVKKTINSEKYKNLKFEFIAGVTNVYSRNNIFYVNRITNEKVYQLPIMPSLAFTMKF